MQLGVTRCGISNPWPWYLHSEMGVCEEIERFQDGYQERSTLSLSKNKKFEVVLI